MHARIQAFLVIIILLLIYVAARYQSTKMNFMTGLWYNEDEKIYIYISDDGDGYLNQKRGAYVIQDNKKITTSDPFTIVISMGLFNEADLTIEGTDVLPPQTKVRLDVAAGKIILQLENDRELILYKDTQTSDMI